MTPNAFRTLALQLPEVIEGTHMNHADFRVHGKIFATLGYPSAEFATLMLKPAEQAEFVQAGSGAFMPVTGAWGLKGSTNVRLEPAERALVKRALAVAWAGKSAAPASRPRGAGRRRSSRASSA
jgi:hypothetical protein